MLGQNGNDQKRSLWNQERDAYFALTDSVTGKIGSRFGEQNLTLFQSISALQPSSPLFFNEDAVKPLAELVQIQLHVLSAELLVGRSFFINKFGIDCSLQEATKVVYPFRDAFPNIYMLYAGASTIGISTATCEISFSTRIIQPLGSGMTHKRKFQLVRLAFEEKLTCDIDLDAHS